MIDDNDIEEELEYQSIKPLKSFPVYQPLENITIDNISITCDDVVKAAKIMVIMRTFYIYRDFDLEEGKEAMKELDKLVTKVTSGGIHND